MTFFAHLLKIHLHVKEVALRFWTAYVNSSLTQTFDSLNAQNYISFKIIGDMVWILKEVDEYLTKLLFIVTR